MQFTLWLFGAEVASFRIGPSETEPEPAVEDPDPDREESKPDKPDRRDCTTYPVGFIPSPGDQRWEKGVDA